MDNNLIYVLAMALVLLGLPALTHKFRSGKNARDFEHKRRSAKLLDNFDEDQNFVDKCSK